MARTDARPFDPTAARRPVVIAGLLVLAVLLSLTGAADAPSQDYANSLLRRALLTFATARGLDSVISAAQGTEIALQPAGLGLTLSAGDPAARAGAALRNSRGHAGQPVHVRGVPGDTGTGIGCGTGANS